MIAPLERSEPVSSTGVTINLHLPDSLKDALMLLISRLVSPSSPSLFPEIERSLHYPQLRPQAPSFASTPRETSPSFEAAAATRSRNPESVSQPADPVQDSPESLLDLYRSRLKTKRLRSASPGTVGDHETSMKAFDRWYELQKMADFSGVPTLHRLSTPVQCLANPEALRLFVRSLIEQGRSPVLINRRLTHLSMLAKVLKLEFEKPTPDEVKRLALLVSSNLKSVRSKDVSDSIQSLTEMPEAMSTTTRRIPSFAEIDAMATAVNHLRYPYGEHAPYFWRGWIRFLAFIGPRSRDVVSTVPRKMGLCRSDVIFDQACPIQDVSNALGYELKSPFGWLHYTIGKDHHSDCRRILFPMPRWMRDWVRFFWERAGDSERLFPSCQPGSKCLSQGPMSEAWQSILETANVDRRIVPSEGKGDRIALRKYAANWWQLATLKAKGDATLAEKMAHYVLHHAEVTTANKHYLSVQALVLPTMLELMPLWQTPAGSAAPVSFLPE